MKRIAIIYLSGTLIVLLAVFFMVSIFDLAGRKNNETTKVKSSGVDKLRVTDLEYTHNQFGQKTFTIHVEELLHKKRKIGPLTINPIKELELHNVRIELYRNNPESRPQKRSSDSFWGLSQDDFSPFPLGSVLGKTFNAKELGFISRVRINRLEVVGFENGREQWALLANKAEMGLQEKHLALKAGVSLSTKQGQTLVTKRLEWRESGKVFYAPGGYVLKDAKGEHGSAQASFTISSSGAILPSR